MARPAKLEEWRVARLLEAVSTLAPVHVCAAYAGIDRGTLTRWRRRGREDRECRLRCEEESAAAVEPSLYERFEARIEEAEVKAELRMLAHIQLAGQDPKNWTACAWLLERRRPEDYSRWRHLRNGGGADLSLDAHELARALVAAQAEVRASVPRPEPSPKPSGST